MGLGRVVLVKWCQNNVTFLEDFLELGELVSRKGKGRVCVIGARVK